MRKGLFLFTVLLLFTHQLFAQCDTVSNWLPTDTANIYTLGSFGFLTGSGNATYDAIAEKFDAPPTSDTLTDVLLYFGVAAGDPAYSVRVAVWEDNGSGSPGAIVATASVPLAVVDKQGPTWVHFNVPPVISSDYFVGYFFSFNRPYYDTLALYHTQDKGPGTSSAWAKNASGPWKPYSDTTFTYQYNISLKIEPVFCDQGNAYPLIVEANSFDVQACAGSTVALYTTANFGSGSYQYQWYPTTGLSNPTIANPVLTVPDSTSTYYVRVIDQISGDTAYSNPIIQNPLYASLFTQGNGCTMGLGGSGIMAATANGGYPPYSYQWSNGGTAVSINGLAPGIYTLTVTDAAGCSYIKTDTITGYNVELFLTSTNDSCGRGVGTASITSNGNGFSGVGWEWSTGSTDSIITGLQAGTYLIDIVDTASGCIFSKSVIVANYCANVSGRVYIDLDQNGLYSAADSLLAGVPVLSSGGHIAITNSQGNYYMPINLPGNYTITPNPLATFFVCGQTLTPVLTAPAIGSYQISLLTPNQTINGLDFQYSGQQVIQCGAIKGHIFNDLDSNGVQDIGEPDVPGIKVMANNLMSITDNDGNYSISVPIGQTYQVSLSPFNNQSYTCGYNLGTNQYHQHFPAGGQGYQVTLDSANPVSTGNDFRMVSYIATYDAGIYNISPYSINYPGETFTVYMDFKRMGVFTSDCTIRVEFDSTYLTLQGASLPIYDSGPGFVEFFFPASSPISFLCMGMSFSLSPNVPAGYVFTWNATFTCDAQDACASNNFLSRSVTYTGVPKKPVDDDLGYTFMRSFPYTDMTDGFIDRNDTIFSYLIQVQNTTGDTVRHLVVTDTLPDHLRVETVSLPFSPRPFHYQIDENGAMLIEFDNIVLPDSSQNFNYSCLFIQYNVVLKGGLPGGTVIRNRAAAYFNYSDVPVFTNYAVNKIAWLDGVEPLNTFEFHVYPNPNNGTFMLQLDKAYDDATLTITNLAGMTVLDMDISGEDKQAIDLHEQGSGVYFVEVVSNGLRQVKKIVVTH